MSSPAAPARPGRREATKAANRQAILDAAREVFGELGYGAATVRDIVRRTDLATGTFYNYFPDKDAVMRALAEQIATEVRARTRAARQRATTLEGIVSDGFRAWFEFLIDDPATFALIRRNAGTTRAMFDEPAVGASTAELAEDYRAAIAAGLARPHDAEYMARAMVGAGFEVAVGMLDRDPPDVDHAVAFVTRLFVGALRPDA